VIINYFYIIIIWTCLL